MLKEEKNKINKQNITTNILDTPSSQGQGNNKKIPKRN